MFKRISYFVIVSILSFSGIAFADANTSNYSYNQNSSQAMSDQELSKKIHDKIGEGYFSKGFDQVKVQVNKGEVTLTGSVPTFADKEKVEKEVRNIDGVKKLNSQVAVQEPREKDKAALEFVKDKYVTPADGQLNQKIRDKISRGIFKDSYQELILNTDNGVVTLDGTVKSSSDKQKIMSEVQKIEGVKGIISNLQISP